MNRSVSSVLSNDTNIFSNHSITVFDHSPTAADRQFQRGRWQKINKKPSGENGKQEMKQEFRKRHINPRSSHRRRPPEDPLKRCLSTVKQVSTLFILFSASSLYRSMKYVVMLEGEGLHASVTTAGGLLILEEWPAANWSQTSSRCRVNGWLTTAPLIDALK